MSSWSNAALSRSLISAALSLVDGRWRGGWLAVVVMLAIAAPAGAQSWDYGDAPSAYPVTIADSGARHDTTAGTPYLGATAPDSEADGQPSADATGDGADEDGVTLPARLIAGETMSLSVVVNATGTVYLDGWIDYNQTNSWGSGSNHIITNEALTAGTHAISFTVPTTVATGTTFARFRVRSASAAISPTGDATDGEVEDYAVEVVQADWGDAPNTYDTLDANNGPRHGITGPFMGSSAPDAENDGQPGPAANGDDTNGADDEDGVTFQPLIRGASSYFSVLSGGGGAWIDAWIDFNGDGDFEDTGEKIYSHAAVSNGSNDLATFTVPSDAAVGQTYARVRISTSATSLGITGLAADGEVEDHRVTILGLDYGDASGANYPTTDAENGARHADTGASPYLGSTGPDVDDDGQPTAGADGDDNDGTDDEDGVSFPSDLIPGETGNVTVTATGVANLDAWIDFNGDGDWADAGEQVYSNQPLTNGPNNLTFSVPAMPQTTPDITTTARFRYSTAGGLAVTGLATDGEVEDLTLNIAPVADLAVAKTVDVATAIPGRTRATYTITVTNNGPSDVSNARVTDTFGSDFIGVVWSCDDSDSGATCRQAGGMGDLSARIDLDDGSSAVFTAEAWVAPGAVGVVCGSDRCLSNTATVNPPSGTHDGDMSNNSADEESAVLAPEGDVSISKDDGLTNASPGDLGAYAIRITNPGPSSVTGATVTDTFPTGLIQGHTDCGGGPDPCWECVPAPSLSFLESHVEGQGTPTVSGLEGASASAMSADGRHLYLTGAVDNSIAVFSRNLTTGAMTFVESHSDGSAGVDGLAGASAVAVSPDGVHVYVTGGDEDKLAVFSRNSSTGELTYHTVYEDGAGGVDGLDGAADVVVSPDGSHLLVAGADDDRIAVFSRDPAANTLTFVESHHDGSAGVDGLDGAAAIALSPDGLSVYVAGTDDDAIARFSRVNNPTSGTFGHLTFLDATEDDSGGVDGLDGVSDVVVSPDGDHLYATGSMDDSVAAFERATDGTLTFIEHEVDGGAGGVNGLDAAAGIAISPNGSTVFAVAPDNSAVAAFDRDPGTGSLTFSGWFSAPGYTEPGATAEFEGLSEAGSISVSPDGSALFATGENISKIDTLVVLILSGGAACPSPVDGYGDLNHQIAVPAHSWVEFTAKYRIRDDATGSIHNDASVTIDQPAGFSDPDSGNNTDGDDTGVGLEVDIEVTMEAGVTAPVPGEPMSYTITVTNHGPQNIDGSNGHITVSDLFPIYNGTTVMAGFDPATTIDWTCSVVSGGQCVDAAGTGNINARVDLSAGGSVELTASGMLHTWSVGNLDNSAAVTLPAAYGDTNPGNDVGSDSRAVAPEAEIGIVKTHVVPMDDFSVDPGDIFAYTIVITNAGPSAVRNAQVTDIFPADLELAATTWTCVAVGIGSLCHDPVGTGNITTTVDLAPMGAATFTATTQVKPTAEGAIINTASVDSGNATDPQSANNAASDTISLTANADLAVTNDDGRTDAVPGQTVNYTITVTNRGAGIYKDDVFGARVVDDFPPELLNVSWTCDPTPPVPGTLTILQLNTLAGRLDGAADAAVSPDGAHVYAVGAAGNALAAYARVTEQGTNFGKLSSAPIDVEQQDISDPEPENHVLPLLDGPTSVAISPDGAHLYVTAANSDAVLVFARDWASASDDYGTVSFVESQVNGEGGVDGIAGPMDATLSPDGAYLYVAAAADNAIAVFERNPATGRLTYLEHLTDGAGGVDGIAGVRALAMSAGGHHLYAAGSADDAVAWFSRAGDTGLLSFENAYFDDDGTIDVLGGAAAIVLSPDGAQLYAAGPDDHGLVTFQRDSDSDSGTFGALSFDVSVTSATAEGLDSVRTLAIPHDAAKPTDRGEHVLAGGDPSGKMVVFRRNVTTGILSFQEVLREGQPLTPPELTVNGLEVLTALVPSPDGRHIYTTADSDNALTVFERRQPDPAFAFVEVDMEDQDDGYGSIISGLSAASSVIVTPDGGHVLATGYTDDSLVVFHRDPELGTTPDTRGEHLAFVAAYTDDGLDDGGATIDGLDGASQVAISPDGNFVYVASELDNAVSVFERDPTTGRMSFIEMEKDGVDDPSDGTGNPVDGLSGAVAVAVSPSGGGSSHLYAAGLYEASVAVFQRDPATGELSFVERKTNGVDSVQGLDGVSGLVVSPDRAHVYAVSRVDDAVVVFERNQTTGELTYLQVIRDGVAAEGLDQAVSVAVSPDGAHLFVTAVNDDALAVFARNRDETSDAYGRLSFVQAITDGAALGDTIVDGLAGARSVAVGRDGLRVFVAGEHDGALSVFGRINDDTAPDFGALNLVETRFDGVDGVDGLNQVWGVAVSLADNSHVYVAGLGDNAVASFEARSGSSCTPSGLGDIDDEINLGWGGQVAYTVEATIAPWATGTLTNTAVVYAPPKTSDPDLLDSPEPQPGDNNYAEDVDNLTPKADLATSKTDGILSATAGESLIYTITVANRGPSHAVGAQVVDSDLAPGPLFANAQWTCQAIGSGSMQLLQVVRNGDTQTAGTVDGLDGASAVAVDANGETLYATGLLQDSVVIFDRDPSTGELSFVGTVTNGDTHLLGTVDGLRGASDIAIIDDGAIQSVYVTGQVDDAVAVFTRNPVDGTLAFVHAVTDGSGGVEGLDQAVAVAADDTGEFVYVAGANDDAIAVFARQPANGSLVFVEVVDEISYGLDGVSDLALTDSPARHLYATGFNSGNVAVFSRAPNGTLSFIEKKGAGTSPYLGGAEALVLDPSGNYLYVAGASDDAVVVFSRSSMNGTLQLQQEIVRTIDGLPGLAGITDLAASPDGAHIYAAGQSADAVVLFQREPADGTLSPVDSFRNGLGQIDGLNGVAGLAFGPDGRQIYAASMAEDGVAVFQRPLDSACPTSGGGGINTSVAVAAGGRLIFTADAVVASDTDGVPCPAPLDPARFCVVNTATTFSGGLFSDPDNGNDSDTDADYLGHSADLEITKTDQYAEHSGLAGATAVAIDPILGRHLYLAGAADGAIALFSRNPGDGTLGYIGEVADDTDGVNGIGGVTDLTLSPDGGHVYATGPLDNAVAVFERDPDSGGLAFLESEINGIGGAAGLLGARAVAVSPGSGDHVYVAGANSDAIAVFERTTDDQDDDFGMLQYLDVVQDGVGGVAGLVTPSALAMTEDHLFAAAAGSDSVAVFERDADEMSPDFGGLVFLASHVDGADGVSGIGGAAALALAPAGDWLFVAGHDSDAVAVFAVDPADGSLTHSITVTQGDVQGGTVDGLVEVRAVRVREDGPDLAVYTAGLADDGMTGAVARFTWNPAAEELSFDEIVLDGDLHAEPVDGLGGAAGLGVADDYLYVAADDDDQLTAFLDAPGLTLLQSFTDGGGGIGPGESDPAQWVQYTITVTNHGPSQAAGAVVTDVFPSEFTDISWVCSVQLAGGGDTFTACQTPSGTGNLDETVDIAVGGSVIFTATGRVRPEMTGTISNTATVATPQGLIDSNPENNSDTDDDTLLTPHADLMVVKTRAGAPVPGADVTYTIAVTNLGPSVALGSTVTDVLPEALVDATWSCQALPAPGLLETTTSGSYSPLDGASSMVVTADNEHLYATGWEASSLMAFARDPRTGALTAVQTLTDGVDGVDGIAGAIAVVASDDGSHVYAAGEIDDAIAVFDRDPASGELSFVEVHRDGIGIVNGLGGVRDLALSPDGGSLYAAGAADNAVAVFDRNPATGALSYVEILQLGVDGVDGIAAASAVAVSHDGDHVYATGALNDAVAVFDRNPSTGELSFVAAVANGDSHSGGVVAGLAGASGLAVSFDDEHVYVVGEIDNAIAVFERDDQTGELEFVESHVDGSGVTGMQGPLGVIVNADDQQVYVAGAVSGAVALFSRAADGTLGFVESFDAAGGYTGLAGVRDLAACSGGRHVYAAGQLDDTIVLLARQMGSTCATDGVGDIVDVVDLIPGGTATYTVTGRLIPGATGELVNTARVEADPTVVDPVQGNNTSTTVDNAIEPQADLAVTKTDGLTEVNAGGTLGYEIQVTNHGPSDIYGASLTDILPIFPGETAGLTEGSVSWTCTASSSLVPFEIHTDGSNGIAGIAGATWVASSPDIDGPGGEPGGDHLYVTGTTADAVSVFALDPGDGTFDQIQVIQDGDAVAGGTADALGGAAGVAVSPDGAHVYVAASSDHAVTVFSRDTDPASPTFGELELVEAQVNGTPILGLEGALSLELSPDGAHLYVASVESDSIMVYRRDPATGVLTYRQRKSEGGGDVPLVALDGVRSLVVAPDGEHLYAVAQYADAVTVFRRDAATGDLAFVEVIRNLDLQGTTTVYGLDFVRSLAFSPGGAYLYTASLADDAIAVFERNRDEDSNSFGRLTFLEVYRDEIDGIQGLDGATAVAVGPDGSYLFAAGSNDDVVAVFRRDWTDGSLTLVELVSDAALDGVGGLEVSADGARLLTASPIADALAVFARTDEAACGNTDASGAGASIISESIDLTAGSTVTFNVMATVDPGARGTLVNEASVSSPLTDPIPGNNTGIDDDTLITVESDLAVTKTDGLETAIAGLPLSYTIVVSNAGPALAYGATVTDTLPPMLLGCACTRSDGQACAVDGTNTLSEVIDIAAGGSLTYTIDCLLDPATAAPVTNTVAVAAENPAHDPDPTNDQATDSDAVVAVSDLAVSKSNGVDEVIPGLPVAYLVEIVNLGPSDLSLGRVIDDLPAQIESAEWSCIPGPGAVCTPGPVMGNLLDDFSVPAGSSVSYTVGGMVNPAVLGTISNTAFAEVLIDDGTPDVSASDPDSANNIATDLDDLTPVADIDITKTDDADPVVTGHPLSYTVTVANPAGPSWAHDVVMTENLPAGVTPVSTTGCAEDPFGVPTCTMGAIANGATAQVVVAVTVDEGTLGTITNTASAVSVSDDPDPSNNSTTEDTQVDPWADLSIAKTDDIDPVVAGTELVYTVTVTNPGPYDADDVVVSDTMPTGVSLVATAGCAEDPAGLPTCSLGSIAAGASKAYTLEVEVDSYVLGTITNLADVSSSWFDPNTSDNDTFEDTEVTAESDLVVSKDNGLTFLVPGWDITYTIVVANDGPSDAPSADVNDEVPPELLDVDWTCVATGGANCTGGTGNLLLDAVIIPAGDSVTYSVNATVDPFLDPSTTPSISNTAEAVVTGAGTDPDTSNNTSTDSDPLEASDLLFADDFENGDTSGWSDVTDSTKRRPIRAESRAAHRRSSRPEGSR
ncbi:MAG: beta-propeller fold lactonase family protein [Thermoanaerobaculales bacterium]|jgi:uncharacterized repeat protein (TIGR01451 family)|nr:beta-propeller fold lactonase family protein [Thermoanaerobaculales bacterium]